MYRPPSLGGIYGSNQWIPNEPKDWASMQYNYFKDDVYSHTANFGYPPWGDTAAETDYRGMVIVVWDFHWELFKLPAKNHPGIWKMILEDKETDMPTPTQMKQIMAEVG